MTTTLLKFCFKAAHRAFEISEGFASKGVKGLAMAPTYAFSSSRTFAGSRLSAAPSNHRPQAWIPKCRCSDGVSQPGVQYSMFRKDVGGLRWMEMQCRSMKDYRMKNKIVSTKPAPSKEEVDPELRGFNADFNELQNAMEDPMTSVAFSAPKEIIAGAMQKYIRLLERPFLPGNGMMLVAAGTVVLERLEEAVEKLSDDKSVHRQLYVQIDRLLNFLTMDVDLLAGNQDEAILMPRVGQTKSHCEQLLKLANLL